MPSNKIPIKTIQFLDISFGGRDQFLHFIKENVTEFALKRQELFKMAGCNPQHFHKDGEDTEKAPTMLIHCINHGGFLLLRAYTQNGINTLSFWFELFKAEHPKFCINTIESNETFTYRVTPKPIHYHSNNWIPFRNISYKNGYYIDKDKENKEIDNDYFNTRLIANILTFVGALGLDTKNIRIKTGIENTPPNGKSIIALKTKQKGTLQTIKKIAFNVHIKINVQLPYIFSLGQNVGYGNGVFIRTNNKHI